MTYKIEISNNFKKEAKRLSKKYRSLKVELSELITDLETNIGNGIHLGNDIYKIRLAVKSKGKGKSGGVRILYFLKLSETTILLFSIYNKGEKDSITDKEILELIKNMR